eukprot:7379776-Prymnesium_polylepis.2
MISLSKLWLPEEDIFDVEEFVVKELAVATREPYTFGQLTLQLKLLANPSDSKMLWINALLDGGSDAYRSPSLLLPVTKMILLVRHPIFFRNASDIAKMVDLCIAWVKEVVDRHTGRMRRGFKPKLLSSTPCCFPSLVSLQPSPLPAALISPRSPLLSLQPSSLPRGRARARGTANSLPYPLDRRVWPPPPAQPVRALPRTPPARVHVHAGQRGVCQCCTVARHISRVD